MNNICITHDDDDDDDDDGDEERDLTVCHDCSNYVSLLRKRVVNRNKTCSHRLFSNDLDVDIPLEGMTLSMHKD